VRVLRVRIEKNARCCITREGEGEEEGASGEREEVGERSPREDEEETQLRVAVEEEEVLISAEHFRTHAFGLNAIARALQTPKKLSLRHKKPHAMR
jgi:hypothetical protein